VPDYITNILTRAGIEYTEESRLELAIGGLDVLYMTRVQRERFFNEDDYVRLKDSYILDPARMEAAKKDMIVLHPLPRVQEITPEVDSDPRAAYFPQAKFGMYVRMALLASVIGE
jgi:aspartate carbamoyltransferase catalytic subunit